MRHQGENFDAGLSRGNVLGFKWSTFHQKSGECHDLQREQIKINFLKITGFVQVLKIHETPRYFSSKNYVLYVLNFQETVEKSIKVQVKRVLLLLKNYVYYFAAASFEAIVCKKIFCGGTS